MLDTWGRIRSINVRKVVWCAQELRLDFQRTEDGGKFGVVQAPDHRALNPNAMAPVIDDGQGAERWMDWQQTTLNKVRAACWN